MEIQKKEGTELLKRTEIEPPFILIEDETEILKKYYVVAGRYKVTEDFETKEEALRCVEEKDWKIIMSLIYIAIEEFKNKEK